MEVKANNILNGKMLVVDWTSDVSGDASHEITGYGGYYLQTVQTSPGENGDRVTDVPTSYTLQLNDVYDFDWTVGEGVARSTGSAELFWNFGNDILLPPSFSVVISAAGDTRKGRVIIFLKDK